MSHPDEGTVQAFLDGELDSVERARLETHFRGCAACAARLAEAREFLQEADRLVELVVVPQVAAGPRRTRGRQAMVRTLAWAASIIVAVAAGYWGRGATSTPPAQLLEGDRPTGVSTSSQGDTVSVPAGSAQPVRSIPNEPVAPAAGAGRLAEEPAPAADTDHGLVATAKGRDAAPEPEAKAVAPVASPPTAAAEREALDARANQAPAKDSRLADAAVPSWRVVSMEEAVRELGGQIRLIDGLTPSRIEVGPGTAVAGADPGFQVVRVVYAGGAVMLVEQRPAPVLGARREAAAVSGEALAGQAAPGWQQRGDIRFAVTGSVSADSLRTLGALVR